MTTNSLKFNKESKSSQNNIEDIKTRGDVILNFSSSDDDSKEINNLSLKRSSISNSFKKNDLDNKSRIFRLNDKLKLKENENLLYFNNGEKLKSDNLESVKNEDKIEVSSKSFTPALRKKNPKGDSK